MLKARIMHRNPTPCQGERTDLTAIAELWTRRGRKTPQSPPCSWLRRPIPARSPAIGAGASATLANGSAAAEHAVVVYAIARRAGRVVAAGHAVIAEVAAGRSAGVQVSFSGDPRGARIELQPDASS